MVALLDDPLARALGEVVARQTALESPKDTHARGSLWVEDDAVGPVGERSGAAAEREVAGAEVSPAATGAGRPTTLPAGATSAAPARAAEQLPAERLEEPPSGRLTERRALEGAALALLVRAFAPIVHELPLEALARVLATADPTTAAAALATTVATDLSARATAAPLLRAWFASARRKRELLEEAGGGLSATQVAAARGITRQAVEKARTDQRLLAVPAAAVAAATQALWPPPSVPDAADGEGASASTTASASATAGDWLYPAAQFGPDGQPLPGLPAVLRAFRTTHVVDPWTQLGELLAPDPEFGDRSVFALLRAEGEAAVPAAVAALRQVGAMGA